MNRMMMDATPFFDYHCDRCDAAFCERVQLMNLALDNTEETFCLGCLAGEQAMAEPEMARFAWEYIQSRDCFKTPWEAFDARPCPRLETQSCYCQDPA